MKLMNLVVAQVNFTNETKWETKWDSFSVSDEFANFIQATSNHCQVETMEQKDGICFFTKRASCWLNLNLARELPWQQNPSTLLEFCFAPKAFKETFICRQLENNLGNNQMHSFLYKCQPGYVVYQNIRKVSQIFRSVTTTWMKIEFTRDNTCYFRIENIWANIQIKWIG